MRKARPRAVRVFVLAAGIVVSIAAIPAGAADVEGGHGALVAPSAAMRAGLRPAPARVPRLPEDVLRAAMRGGVLVRRAPGLRVTRVSVPRSLLSASPAAPTMVWRVSVAGRFPPRALRYVVSAGGHPVGYGTPRADEHAVRTVTTDAAVLSSHVRAYYEEAPGPIAAAGAVRSSASATPPDRDGDRLDNPAAPGPYPVQRSVYNLGDQAFQPSGIDGKVELTADVHYPRGLHRGPYPLVLFLHGNHSSCFRGDNADYTWPCRSGFKPLPNFAGYDYIARRLASYGYIVVSISGNGVNVLGNQAKFTGMRQRGELIEKHIDLWRRWDTTGGGPFGDRFIGKVDLARIGTMGHSRGGEGAIWNVIVDRERPDPYGIDAVLALAPVDFSRTTVNDVPLAVMLPYCDGDVYDLQGMHFFDDARYRVPGDPTPKDAVTVMGANHNFFNTVWTPSSGYPGAFDDSGPGCPGRLTEVEQRRVGASYIVGFFRRYVGGETPLDPMWTGAATPRPIPPSRTEVSYLAPDRPSRRLDVDRFTSPSDLSRDQLGGKVTASGMSFYGWCEDSFANPCIPGPFSFNDVHLPGLSQGILGWSNHHAGVRFAVPRTDRDVHRFDAFQLRCTLNPGYDANRRNAAQDLALVMVDGDGNRASATASSVGNEALQYPPGLGRFGGHVILNQLRFPLGRFRSIDLRDVRAVRLRFSQTRTGVIDVADLAFSRGTRSNG